MPAGEQRQNPCMMMKAHLGKLCAVLLTAAGAWISACRGRPAVIPSPGPSSERSMISPLGYTVQAGAFSLEENAAGLTGRLRRAGLDAFFFRHHPSRLYKVRFGDFATRGAARRKAEQLLEHGIIEDFIIVGPGHPSFTEERDPDFPDLRDRLVQTAERYLGVEYSWGGDSRTEGFDCSGLAAAVYRLNGLRLPRSSRDQFRSGRPVGLMEMKKGDLVFFSGPGEAGVSHVGVYTGNGEFIHAPGEYKKIRKDSLDNPYFNRRFLGARTYL